MCILPPPHSCCFCYLYWPKAFSQVFWVFNAWLGFFVDILLGLYVHMFGLSSVYDICIEHGTVLPQFPMIYIFTWCPVQVLASWRSSTQADSSGQCEIQSFLLFNHILINIILCYHTPKNYIHEFPLQNTHYHISYS